MRKLVVIEGGRDRELVEEEKRLHRLIGGEASVRIEGRALVALTKLGVHLGQLKNALSRSRVRGFEANAELQPRILRVDATIAEDLGRSGQRLTLRRFALKVVVEEPTEPGRIAIIEIGRLAKRRERKLP